MRPSPALLLVAAGLLSSACETRPDAVREHARRGEAAIAEGRYAEAFSAYTHARELAPHDPSLQRGTMRARAYAIADQPAKAAPEILEDARYEARLLADTDPAHAAVYLSALGNLTARQGDFEGARALLEEAVKKDPAEPIAHTALGLLLGTRKEHGARAKAEIEAALQRKPDHVPALVAMGQIALVDGDVASAVPRLQAAVKARDEAGARLLLGEARQRQQRFAEAAEHFQRATELEAKSADAWSALGQALLAAGKPDEAERALRQAAQLRGDPSTLAALGFALVRQKKSSEALGVFGQTLERDATSGPALFGAALAAEDLGRPGQALELYRRLLSLPAQPALAGMTKEAEARVASLTAASAPGASATAAASAAPSAAPAAKMLPAQR